jgi:hypothetical protein
MGDGNAKAKRNFKDSVFTDYFTDASRFRELYNALPLGSKIGPASEIVFVDLKDVMFTNMHNDIAALVDNKLLILSEHMSSSPLAT